MDGASHISARPERVLLVDDDQDILRFIEMLKRREGFRDISTADQGEEGLRLAMSLLPDLVLTNVQMARISGFEMVEKIRRDLTEPCMREWRNGRRAGLRSRARAYCDGRETDIDGRSVAARAQENGPPGV